MMCAIVDLHARLNCSFRYHDYQTYYEMYQLNKLLIRQRETTADIN
jgi:hypothetical protein